MQLQDAVLSIAAAIARTRTELASLRDGQDAARLVDGTADATHTILFAAEAANDLTAILRAGASPEASQSVAVSIEREIQMIFEACNFQDLAGQRIGKVLRTLAFIETRIGLIDSIWDGGEAEVCPDPLPERTGDMSLLNGPALPGASAVSQKGVDSFFS